MYSADALAAPVLMYFLGKLRAVVLLVPFMSQFLQA
jgi:hypothetical protein